MIPLKIGMDVLYGLLSGQMEITGQLVERSIL
jgi:hypothetical protein